MYAKILDYCMMFYNTLKQEKILGVLLRVGFDKTFDSISWSFIPKIWNSTLVQASKRGLKPFIKMLVHVCRLIAIHLVG